jgi:hypothetical protein
VIRFKKEILMTMITIMSKDQIRIITKNNLAIFTCLCISIISYGQYETGHNTISRVNPIDGFGLFLKDADLNFNASERLKMKELGISVSETGNIEWGVAYFSHEKDNPFRNEFILSNIINQTELEEIKSVFNEQNKIVVDIHGNYGFRTNPVVVKAIIQKVKNQLLSIESKIKDDNIYKMVDEKVLLSYSKLSISIDSVNDFKNHAYQKYNGEKYGSVLYSYSNIGGHKFEEKRDYVAWYKGTQRDKVDDWIYIRNTKEFEYLGTKYVVISSNSYSERVHSLDRIIFLCDLSLKYGIMLYMN